MRMNDDAERDGVRRVAELMCVAARTAPKARGFDQIVTAIVEDDEELEVIAARMREIGERCGAQIFPRDAQNMLDAQAVVLIGSGLKRLRIAGCSFCGYDGCQAAEAAHARCAYNAGDLGIATGSAVAVAADHRVDNRIMYTIGSAVVELGLLGPEVEIAWGIPLSAAGKNIFFDRK
ncbi:MAG: ferredoxin domain-containing protein [Armatimonadota bacterium]|jgi:uncharacterized ferredoxin-like protein